MRKTFQVRNGEEIQYRQMVTRPYFIYGSGNITPEPLYYALLAQVVLAPRELQSLVDLTFCSPTLTSAAVLSVTSIRNSGEGAPLAGLISRFTMSVKRAGNRAMHYQIEGDKRDQTQTPVPNSIEWITFTNSSLLHILHFCLQMSQR